MNNKRMISIMLAMLILGSSMTAYAKPKTMPDGTKFDAEYYAENNPDVVAALGSSEKALYQHYQQYGRTEGRKAYADDKPAATTSGGGQRSALAKSTKTSDNQACASRRSHFHKWNDIERNRVGIFVVSFIYLCMEHYL